MPEKQINEWIVPTMAGMLVSLLRRFRKNRNERFGVVVVRFLTHVGTCMIAGYIVGGAIDYLEYPRLLAPMCALAGLYGTMLVDWVEETGLVFLTTWIKSKIEK